MFKKKSSRREESASLSGASPADNEEQVGLELKIDTYRAVDAPVMEARSARPTPFRCSVSVLLLTGQGVFNYCRLCCTKMPMRMVV